MEAQAETEPHPQFLAHRLPTQVGAAVAQMEQLRPAERVGAEVRLITKPDKVEQ